MRCSYETQLLLAQALGRLAWENGATDNRGVGCDCVMLEESHIWEGINKELHQEAVDTIFTQMYASARELAHKEGDRR
jgi:hypothetical protein